MLSGAPGPRLLLAERPGVAGGCLAPARLSPRWVEASAWNSQCNPVTSQEKPVFSCVAKGDIFIHVNVLFCKNCALGI